MDTRDYINQFRDKKDKDKLAYVATTKCYNVAGMPLIEYKDAKLVTGRYAGMKLSDIFIFDPNYLEFLNNHEKVDAELKEIICEVTKNQRHDADRIARKLALGGE